MLVVGALEGLDVGVAVDYGDCIKLLIVDIG